MKRLYARHRLDITPSDLAFALGSMAAVDSDRAAWELEELWSPGTALACYSVRSGFHLLLSRLALPAGSEVLFSAVTHPDMPRLAEHHGLVPVPVDLDVDTLAPRPEQVIQGITPRTRMLVVAHLFGGQNDLAPLARICRRHGLLLVEDCAQSFRGPQDTGDVLADVSMFSFGILKTATALGGALFTIRDLTLLDRMRVVQADWPLQPAAAQLKRIAQAAAFVSLTRPLPYTLVERLAAITGANFDHRVNSAAKAFPAGSTGDLVGRLERRPSAPLLRLLEHRLRNFDHARLARRAASGDRLASMLPPGLHVGGAAPNHSRWLFPVAPPEPAEVIDAARAAGFDAARKASSVSAIAAPAHMRGMEPRAAIDVMSRLVFLPAYPELPEGALGELARALEGSSSYALALSH
jgi:perosamine synthetase